MTDLPDPEDVLARVDAKNNEPVEVLSPTTTLSIDCKDGRGYEYKHDFYFKVPTLGDRVQIANMKLSYLPGGVPPDVMAVQLVHMICYLTVAIQFNEKFPKPHWWDFWKLYDATPFSRLYEEATLYESKFLGEDSDARRDEGQDREEEDTGGGDGEAHVGRKVRPPAERRETLASHGSGGT